MAEHLKKYNGKKEPKQNNEEKKTCIKGLGHCSDSAGSFPSRVDVKNDKLTRIRPFDFGWRYDPEEFNPWKIETGGKEFKPPKKTLLPPHSLAYKKRVYSPNRVRYPLKRVDWNPNEERNPENRGKSGYERISWDEALDIIAVEIERIKEKYGPESILSQGEGHGQTKIVHGPHGCQTRLLQIMGGCTVQVRNPDSWEGWYWGAKHVWGMDTGIGLTPVRNIVPDIAENSELILFWGCDPETSTWGWHGQIASRLCYWFSELDIRSIYVCPDLNYGAAVHADKWIPIRPNTDAALQLAIAYQWIVEGTYDEDYIETHTHGFDEFEEYVLGNEDEDDFPKTPEWAEEITGVSSRVIKALAREWASKRTSIAHVFGGPYIRGPYSHEPARLEVLLLSMQGLGKPGVHQLDFGHFGMAIWPPAVSKNFPWFKPKAVPSPQSVYSGWHHIGKKYGRKFLSKQFIPKTLIPDAILDPPITWYSTAAQVEGREVQFEKYSYPFEGCSEIHMIWTDTPCWTTCWNEGDKFVKAAKSPKIEFILAQHPWMENDCPFADIILPSTTKFEEEDIGVNLQGPPIFYNIYHEEKCIEPIGESKSDYEIVCEIADRLGLLEEYTDGESVEDKIRRGFETSGVQDMIEWDEFKEKGYFVVPNDPEWEASPGLRDFYEDPEGNPLDTPTGKIEFYSEGLAEHFPDDEERPPVPHWIPYGESHQESLEHSRSSKYPLLMMSNHPRWRVHAQLDDVTWFHEIPTCKIRGPDGYLYEPLWINPEDAEERSIEDGDVVKIYNERGAVLGGAYVTERIMQGAVGMEHGARTDLITERLDRGGAINTITPHKTTSKNAPGIAVSGFLVEVERADLDELERKYPEAFEEPYDRAAGQTMERVLAEGESL